MLEGNEVFRRGRVRGILKKQVGEAFAEKGAWK